MKSDTDQSFEPLKRSLVTYSLEPEFIYIGGEGIVFDCGEMIAKLWL